MREKQQQVVVGDHTHNFTKARDKFFKTIHIVGIITQ